MKLAIVIPWFRREPNGGAEHFIHFCLDSVGFSRNGLLLVARKGRKENAIPLGEFTFDKIESFVDVPA